MRRYTAVRLWALFCLLTLVPSIVGRADTSPDTIRRGKKATALVQSNEAEGTAFCIAASGLFVTNQHVVEGADKSKLKLILNAGEANQRIVQATVVREDKEADIALLQAFETEGFTLLPLGDAEDLIETQSVVAFGYPFGSELALGKEKYPNISVNVGRITALRREAGRLQQIQLDAALNPGNSGGPIVNEKGDVVGIVQSGVPGAGVNFAIPITRLRAFLRKAQAILRPPLFTPDTERMEQEWGIDVLATAKPGAVVSVTLALTAPGQETREFTAKSLGGNRYSVHAAPVPVPVNAPTVRVLVKDASSEGDYVVKNRTVSVGDHACKLSEIKRIVRGPSGYALMASGQKLRGGVSGLTALETVGSGSIRINLSESQDIRIQPVAPEGQGLTYRIVVREDGQVICDNSGALTGEDAPIAPDGAARPADPQPVDVQPGGAGLIPSQTGVPISFAEPLVYNVPVALEYVAAADLDGDKWPDVVVGGAQELGVLYNHRNGALEPYVHLLSWQAGVTVRDIADLNGDGRPDIIFTDTLGRLVILFGQGGRRFAEPYFEMIGQGGSSLCVADVNKDGRPDLVIGFSGDGGSGDVKVLLNNGNGTFREQSKFRHLGSVEGVSVRDVNGDGLPDMAVSFETSTVDRSGVTIYYGDGKGNFQGGPTYNLGTQNMFSPLLQDFNGDGKPDLVVCNYWGGNVAVLTNAGDGSFLPLVRYPADAYPIQVRAADFNGDGLMDMVVPSAGRAYVSVYRNRGAGIFVDPLHIPTGGENSRSCCIADFNRDGKPDIVVQSETSKTISILLNTSGKRGSSRP